MTFLSYLRRGFFTFLFFSVFCAFAATFSLPVKADGDRFLIDFGSSTSTTSVTGWNNITNAQAKDITTIIPLKDSLGVTTPVTFQFTDGFNCITGDPVNTIGTQTSNLYPSSATIDSFYLGTTSGGVCTQNDTTAVFIVRNLPQNATYDLKFYASRADTSAAPTNRTANYKIGPTTVSLNATNNTNGVATITNVVPINGTITVTVEKAAVSAGFGYLGIVDIVKKINPVPPTASAGADQTITLPNHSVTLTGNGTDTDGSITSYQWTEVSSGAATINNPASATTTITDLAAGVYTFKLTVTDNQSLIASDEVVVTVNPQSFACSAKRIVIIGSSTAAGTGANPVSNSWVNRYTSYLQQVNPSNTIVNFAVSGYNSYHEMPTTFIPPAGRPTPDPLHNITAAIAQNPNAIIVNLPSNDVTAGYTLSEIKSNFQAIRDAAVTANIPVWFSTTQPRTASLDQTGRNNQMVLRDWMQTTFAPNVFDFWTTVANADGTIATLYSAGDGVHLNNLGHQKLYNRVAGSNLIGTICTTPTPTP